MKYVSDYPRTLKHVLRNVCWRWDAMGGYFVCNTWGLLFGFPEDVFLMSTKDPKSPIIYAVFTTSRYCACDFGHNHWLLDDLCFQQEPTDPYLTHSFCPLATSSKVQPCVCTAWQTSGECSWVHTPIEMDQTISGCPSRDVSPTHVLELWVQQKLNWTVCELWTEQSFDLCSPM